MTTQNYLIVESNIVTNTVVWDGDINTWQPPVDSIQLVAETTPALLWESIPDTNPPEFYLKEYIGAGDIGFTWDATTQVLTTNQLKPTPPKPALGQPTANGTTTI
jgi:hypothetical protein